MSALTPAPKQQGEQPSSDEHPTLEELSQRVEVLAAQIREHEKLLRKKAK